MMIMGNNGKGNGGLNTFGNKENHNYNNQEIYETMDNM